MTASNSVVSLHDLTRKSPGCCRSTCREFRRGAPLLRKGVVAGSEPGESCSPRWERSGVWRLLSMKKVIPLSRGN